MLRQELQKNEEEEAASARERLFTPPSDSATAEENAEDQSTMNELDEAEMRIKAKELFEEETSESSEIAEEKIKEEQRQSTGDNDIVANSGGADDVNGSTVQIVQPADLKPKHLGFTLTLLLAMCAAMIGTGAQFGYALGVMNAPSQVTIRVFH
jgi:hypothetical protein